MTIHISKGLQGATIAEFDDWYGVEIRNRELVEEVTTKANEMLAEGKSYNQALKYALDAFGVSSPFSDLILQTYHEGKFEVDEAWDEDEDEDSD